MGHKSVESLKSCTAWEHLKCMSWGTIKCSTSQNYGLMSVNDSDPSEVGQAFLVTCGGFIFTMQLRTLLFFRESSSIERFLVRWSCIGTNNLKPLAALGGSGIFDRKANWSAAPKKRQAQRRENSWLQIVIHTRCQPQTHETLDRSHAWRRTAMTQEIIALILCQPTCPAPLHIGPRDHYGEAQTSPYYATKRNVWSADDWYRLAIQNFTRALNTHDGQRTKSHQSLSPTWSIPGSIYRGDHHPCCESAPAIWQVRTRNLLLFRTGRKANLSPCQCKDI